MSLYTKLAWRNIFRNKRRTFITGTAIAIGLTALIFLDARHFNLYAQGIVLLPGVRGIYPAPHGAGAALRPDGAGEAPPTTGRPAGGHGGYSPRRCLLVVGG